MIVDIFPMKYTDIDDADYDYDYKDYEKNNVTNLLTIKTNSKGIKKNQNIFPKTNTSRITNRFCLNLTSLGFFDIK